MQNGASKPSWMQRLVRWGLTLLVLALVFEIGLRFFGYGSYIIYAPDDELLWAPLPNQQGHTVAGRETITMNSDQLRYPEDLPRQADGEVRIFSFGDSVTMGWGMDDQSHYTAVLADLVAPELAPLTVRGISAGVNAYPPTLCVRRFEKLLREGHQIDVAILAYSFNRGHESLVRLEGEARESFLNKVRIKSIVRRFALYNFLIEDVLRTAVYYRLRDRLLAGSWDLKTNDERQREGADQDYLVNLERMRQVSEEHGVQLVYLLLGSLNQTGGLNNFQQALLEYTQDNDLPLVNMIERQASLDHEELYIDHTHPSALGHRLIAEELAPWVLKLLAEPEPAEASPDETAQEESGDGTADAEQTARQDGIAGEGAWPKIG